MLQNLDMQTSKLEDIRLDKLWILVTQTPTRSPLNPVLSIRVGAIKILVCIVSG